MLNSLIVQYPIFQEAYEWARIFINKHSIWTATIEKSFIYGSWYQLVILLQVIFPKARNPLLMLSFIFLDFDLKIYLTS